MRYVAHMGEKSDVYKDFVGKCKGNKLLGRPSNRCGNNITIH